jgi:hypothetical protein
MMMKIFCIDNLAIYRVLEEEEEKEEVWEYKRLQRRKK